MKAHTDEPLTGGSRVKTRRGLLSRKRVRRCGIGAAALSIVMLLSSCMSQGEVTETRAAQLSVGDAVIAVRLSEGKFSAGLPAGRQLDRAAGRAGAGAGDPYRG